MISEKESRWGEKERIHRVTFALDYLHIIFKSILFVGENYDAWVGFTICTVNNSSWPSINYPSSKEKLPLKNLLTGKKPQEEPHRRDTSHRMDKQDVVNTYKTLNICGKAWIKEDNWAGWGVTKCHQGYIQSLKTKMQICVDCKTYSEWAMIHNEVPRGQRLRSNILAMATTVVSYVYYQHDINILFCNITNINFFIPWRSTVKVAVTRQTKLLPKTQ